MLIGAIVFAALVLLLLLSERGSSRMWRGGRPDALFYCRPCDLRYPRGELVDQRDWICPVGHFTEPVPADFPFGTVLIVACVAFIGLGLVLVATGVVPTP